MISFEKLDLISKKLDISKTTIGRFFHNPEKLHIDTYRKITEFLSVYCPEELRLVSKTDTRDILFIIQDIHLLIIADIIKTLLQIGSEKNFGLRLYNNSSNLNLSELIKQNKKKWIDIRGIIMLAPNMIQTEINETLIPTVFLNTPSQIYGLSITVNDYYGGKIALEHLYKNGFRKPIFISYDASIGVYECARDRLNGYKIACEELGIECRYYTTDFSMEASYNLTQKLLKNKDFDSIFYVCDEMAIGGLQALSDANITLGADIGVLGFDNIEISKFLGLSSVDQTLSQKLNFAVDYILFGNGRSWTEKSPEISFTPEIVERASSIKIRQ